MNDAKQAELYTGKEWQDEQLAGELDGEWVEVKEGLKLEGELVRAFATLNEESGQPRACYAIKGQQSWPGGAVAEGVFLLGERAAFKQAIRELRLGTSVRITFLAKEPVLANGKKTGREMWKMKFQSKRDGRGETVEKALFTYWKRNLAAQSLIARPNPASEEFVPF